ncbi:MAG: acyl carrier protein [Syntrophobacteraceae bacterium]|jgi:acyl carrier protein
MIAESLEKFLLTEVAVGFEGKSLGPDEDLLERGLIDSLGMMKLIVFIEETSGITVNDEEIIPDNFQTLNSMVKFIEQKMQNK